MRAQDFKADVFAKVRQAGFSDTELYSHTSVQNQVKVFQGEVDSFTLAESGGVSFRGVYRGKMGYSYTEIMDESAAEMLVQDARENAMVIEDPDQDPIFAGSGTYPEFEGYSEALAQVSSQERIEFVKELEAQALADKRVRTVSSCLLAYVLEEINIENTLGLQLARRKNGCYCWLSVLVGDETETRSFGRFDFSRDFGTLDAKRLAGEAVAEATGLLGAAPVASGTYPILLRHDAAASLLAAFAGMFSAENVHKNLSLLKGKLHTSLASSQVTISDDPLLPRSLYSSPFDAEGVASRGKHLVEKGVLRSYLHNLKTAGRSSVESTGNAVKHSYKSEVTVAPTNLFIQPGDACFNQLAAGIDKGLVIVELQGTHAGTNPVSGDFSLAALGYLVEDGQIKAPVDQITVAGNILELLADVEAVGSDLDFCLPAGSMVGAPSLLVKKLAVAGK